ncbi:PilN domain-containing protein [Amphibiibacter pelophylacis]|uniref:PilN domain-containing protein n=1 Tax=Amphibiibacter pelophylacis TaxID=1799477 RepID=A0ACC6P480_9BURK
MSQQLRINLLPHREAARKARKQQFFVYTALAFVAGLVLGGLWFTVEVRAVDEQNARNSFLTAESAKLDTRIKDIATLRSEIEALKSRQGAVETLQGNRNVAVALFNELVSALPRGVSISSIKQDGTVVTVVGLAESNERVAEFIRNATGPTLMINNPELVEVQAGAGATPDAPATPAGGRTGRPAAARYAYTLKLHLNPQALGQALVAAPADGATPPASTAKAPAAAAPPAAVAPVAATAPAHAPAPVPARQP